MSTFPRMSEMFRKSDRHRKPQVTAATIAAILTTVTTVTIIGFYLLAAYIVYKTGATTGIADIGRAVAAIIAAITNSPEP